MHTRTHTVTRDALRLTVAASLLVLAQAATAADEVTITPRQRQVSIDKPGIITLKFEVENRSGQTQQFQESLSLPEGWELVTNTAPFQLTNGAREVRLVHISAPRGTASGAYKITYHVAANNNGSITNSQTVTVQMQEQAGIKLTAPTPPGSLLGGESYDFEFLVANTGNHPVTYTLSGHDEEGYITKVEPRQLTLQPGSSAAVKVNGSIPRDIEETTAYKLSLQARGGGKLAEESVTIPLISRTPKGIGKFQKLPGKLTSRYTRQQQRQENGSTSDTTQAQIEYYARGAIDQDAQHNLEIRLRNGMDSSSTGLDNRQQAAYQINYEAEEWQVKTGHHTFSASSLSGNALSGIGAEATYTPNNGERQKPLKVKAFTGQSRAGDTNKEKVAGAAVQYQWDEFDSGASIIRHQKAATATEAAKQETIAAIEGSWRGEQMGVHTEIAKDNDAKAWRIEANGQWQSLGVNLSHLQADTQFDGGSTDTKQSFANTRYQIDEQTSLETRSRQIRNNLAQDQTKEIRQDKEHEIRVNRRLGSEQQIEISLGHSRREERDLRTTPTTDRDIQTTTLSYQHQFDDISIQAGASQGSRTDRIKTSSQGNKQELVVNWQLNREISLNANYAHSRNLDSDGVTSSVGMNTTYKPNKKSALSAYVQRNQNHGEGTHSNSVEIRYNHDLKRWGSVGISTRKIDSQTADGKTDHDNITQVEYGVPLDMPIGKRDDIGSVKGEVRYAADQRPASEVVVQMGGQYAVTDQKGEFSYPDVLAKEYKIQIDGSRANTQGLMLSQDGADTNVTVQPNQTVKPKLELHPASRISGKLLTYTVDTTAAVLDPGNSGSALKADQGLGMVLIELQPVGEIGKRIVHKRTTLHDGSFSFVGIPPGQWQLVVTDTNKLPPNYRLEQSQFTVDLTAGSAKDIQIRAIPSTQGIKKTGPSGGFSVTG